MSNFNDIILNELRIKHEKIMPLEEGLIPLSPFLAVAALKKAALNRLKRTKAFLIAKKIARAPTKARAKAEIATEKAKATAGITAGKGEEATVYRLTSEQVKVIIAILKRYGMDVIKDIIAFRRNILAPYQKIKRIIKKSKRVSSKEITGMAFEQFKAAVESGRKKIEARGEEHFGKSRELQGTMKEFDEKINALEAMSKNFFAGGKPSYNIASRVYKAYGVGDEELEGYSREFLRRAYEGILKTTKGLEAEVVRLRSRPSLSPGDFARAQELITRSRELSKGIDLTSDKEFEDEKGDFNVALGRYFFSREIWKELTASGKFNIYKKTYLSIIDEMSKNAKNKKKKTFGDLVKLKRAVEFTPREKMIWTKRPGIREFSGRLRDYYQKVTADQFLEKPIAIEKSPELVKAQREIENEIKKFERKLGKTLTAEDLNKLKKYRLINNPITVKELRSPEKLFKTRQDFAEYEEEEEPEREEVTGVEEEEPGAEDYVSPIEFYRKIREIATVEYDTILELQNAKKGAKALAKQMAAQGDKKEVEKHRDILKRIELRRDTATQKLVGHELEPTGIVDVDDIQRLANRIISRTYTSVDETKHDKLRLDKLIDKYKEVDPEDAEKNLSEIDFLLKRAKRKLEVGK